MFQENIKIIIDSFSKYKGDGMYMALFFISMLYIFIKEEDKNKKIFFTYYNFIILFITLNPLFNKIVGSVFKSGVYVRVFWMLSIGITIAYSAIDVIYKCSNKTKKIIATIFILLIIICSGKLVYNKQNYLITTANKYRIPDESLQVAQLIESDEENHKKALVSESLVAYIRQVDANIELAYKREPQGYANNKFVLAMLQGDSEQIAKLATENDCNYIVLKKAIPLTLDMKYFGFSVLEMTENYVIYKLEK